MPGKPSTFLSVPALGSKSRKNPSRESIALKDSASQIITSVPLAVPCQSCGYASGVVVRRKKIAFAVKCGNCDAFQFPVTDEQLEIIAASLPVGGCDE